MAAPSEVTLKNLGGKYTLNKSLSDSNEPILKIQGVNWIMRKAIDSASLTLTIKQYADDGGVTHLDMELKPSGGPQQLEERVLDWEQVNDIRHPLFGNGKVRSKWAGVDEIGDEFLAKGWEDGTETLILMQSDLDSGASTTIVHGFELVKGERHYVRHVLTKKGKEEARVRMVYDYVSA